MLLDLWARGLYTKGECFGEKSQNKPDKNKVGAVNLFWNFFYFERVITPALQIHPLDLIPDDLCLFYGIFINI